MVAADSWGAPMCWLLILGGTCVVAADSWGGTCVVTQAIHMRQCIHFLCGVDGSHLFICYFNAVW